MDIREKFTYRCETEDKMLNIILKHTLRIDTDGVPWVHFFFHI